MGRKKQITMYNGRYMGKALSEEICRKLDSLNKVSVGNGYIEDLKRVITELSPHSVDLVKANKGVTAGVEKTMGTLEDYQTVGVAYMYYAKRMVLGDSVGLGKTVQICGLINLLRLRYAQEGFDFKALYLTEKNLVEETREKVIKFTGDYVDALYGDKKSILNFADVSEYSVLSDVVGSHSVMTSPHFWEWFDKFVVYNGCIPFDLLIIDESEILKNNNTNFYKRAKMLADQVPYVIIANATAFEKELKMLYNQLAFVDDTFLPPKGEFSKSYEIMDYTGAYPTPSGKYKNTTEFKHLVGYRYWGKTRKQLGYKMSNCKAVPIISRLSSVQKDLLRKVGMPSMVYDCPSYFDSGISLDIYTTPKLESLLTLINGELKNEKSILIYCRYKEAQRGLQEALFNYAIDAVVMNGDTDIKVKNSIIARFKENQIRVLITNVQKGLDFGNCDTCIFYSYDSTPSKMVQFEGRTTRSRDIMNKKVYLLISEGRELDNFRTVVADRAVASDMFIGSDFSCVLSLLLDSGVLDRL